MQKTTNIYLIRHGEIEKPKEKSFIGQTDLPLNERGKLQAKNWKNYFEKKELSAIICSDLNRCMESAKLLCPTAVNIIYEPKFREINLGTWEGQSIAHIKENYAQDYIKRGEHIDSFRPPNGESFNDLSKRVNPALAHYINTYAGKNIAIIAHAGVNRVIIANYLALNLKDVLKIPQYYACCTHLQY